MFSNSASSSPDILAPPGDVDYLISSPFRPFAGRQSSLMSPANFRILQTPGAAKRKRSRISLSPAKTAHSIRFDDIVLPGSPSKKPNGRQRSLSPEKAQADGDVSPWRIRVTLEATQDDQENQGSPSRKRSKPATTTMKIPLKDDSEQTPRRRGRPRKSGALDATPRPGSPGNTPGPASSEQKRRRGRPRKHRSEPDTIGDNAFEGSEQPEVDAQVADPAPAGTELERRSWSPLNLAGDADSDDEFDDNQRLDVPFEDPEHVELPDAGLATEGHDSQPTIERAYDTPNGDAIDRFHYQQGSDDLHSTPSKMPSPTRDLQSPSPENSINAGHTPMPPRIYPTPTPSSLVDDERQERNQFASGISASASKPSEVRTNDPTDEHREFDSIMESEGFSMVSLDTLPSSRQHELRSNSKLAKGPLKPFIERETNGVLRRKTNILEPPREKISPPGPSPDPAPSPERHLDSSQQQASSQSAATKRTPFSPIASRRSPPVPQRKPLLQLAKLVKAGIALEGVLSHSNPPYSPGNPVPDYMVPRQRLEVMFSDLNTDSQRVLRAALGLAQVLAIRKRLMDLRSPQRRALVEEEFGEEEGVDSPDFEHTKPNVSRTPTRQYDGVAESSPVKSTPGTEMKRRFAEWQREREAVSRTIQMANSSQVVVIESDTGSPSSAGMGNADDVDYADQSPWISRREEQQGVVEEEHHDDEGEGRNYDFDQSPQKPRQEEEQQEELGEEDYGNEEGSDFDVIQRPQVPILDEDQRQEKMVEEEDYGNEEREDYGVDVDDDDGYEDIWQEQAKDEGTTGQESMLEPQNDVQWSPWKGGSTPADRQYSTTFSPAYWVDEQRKVPYLGQSRVRELREQQVDISALLQAEDTPNRARYYYGQSSPLRPAPGHSPQHIPSSAISQRQKGAARYEAEPDDLDVEPEEPEEEPDYLDFSPEKDLEDETFQIDPATRHESEMQRHQSDFADNASISDNDGQEPAVHEETLTPRGPEPANKDAPASSCPKPKSAAKAFKSADQPFGFERPKSE
ncbi:hypothetical protein BJX76DRAFT_359496 [Aspergillus varians]